MSFGNPDLNLGSLGHEAKFKKISQAYNKLEQHYKAHKSSKIICDPCKFLWESGKRLQIPLMIMRNAFSMIFNGILKDRYDFEKDF